MRNEIISYIKTVMSEDESFFFLTADMGGAFFIDLQRDFPNRTLNVGIAEQSLISTAVGLSSVGYRVICYGLSCFITLRALDQIKSNVCIPNIPVILLGTSTGYDAALMGGPHITAEDICCLNALPNIEIYSPSTKFGVKKCFKAILHSNSPSYIRVGGELILNNPEYDIGDCCYYLVKKDCNYPLVMTYGSTLEYALEASLKYDKFSIMCIDKLKSLGNMIKDVLIEYKNIIVIEEQFGHAGLYSILCEYIMTNNITEVKITSISPSFEYPKIAGDRGYFADKYGYSSDKLVNKIKLLIESGD